MSTHPELLVLTDRRACAAAGHSLTWVVAAAIEGGAKAFVLREKDLDAEARRSLAVACLAVTDAAGASLGIASDLALAAELGGLPVHLAAADPIPAAGGHWGRSCHDPAGVARAAAEGAAYVTASPVFLSAAKPGYGPPLGLGDLGQCVAAARVAVFALGGVSADNAGSCVAAGAAGVAVMSSVMGAADPASAVRALLASLHARHPAFEHT